MASRALTEKHTPLNDQQGPPTQGASCLKIDQRSHLPLNSLQASFLSWDTAQPSRKLQSMHKVPPSQQDSEATHLVTASLRTYPRTVQQGQNSSLLATPSGTSNSLLIIPHKPPTDRNYSPVRSPVRCRTYAAVAPRLGVWPRLRTSSCCCCSCCCCS